MHNCLYITDTQETTPIKLAEREQNAKHGAAIDDIVRLYYIICDCSKCTVKCVYTVLQPHVDHSRLQFNVCRKTTLGEARVYSYTVVDCIVQVL